MILLRPKPWTTMKPPVGVQVDWGHPLAQGLQHAFLFNERGSVIDLAQPLRGTPSGTTWVQNVRGGGVRFTGTNNQVISLGAPANGLSTRGFTVTMLLSAASGGQGPGKGRILSVGTEAANDPVLLIGDGDVVSGSRTLEFVLVTGTTRLTSNNFTPSYSIANYYMAWCTYNGAGTGTAANFDWRIATYPQGAVTLATYQTSTNGTNGQTFAGAWRLGNTGVGTRAFDGDFVLFYTYQGVLSVRNMTWQWAEPYAFLKPQSPRIRYFFPSVAAGGGPGVVVGGHRQIYSGVCDDIFAGVGG